MRIRARGCATRHQIEGLIQATDSDVTQAPGYDGPSPEAQEQVQLAFENGDVVDKDFKGKRVDFTKTTPRYNDILDAEG
jgi:hypothetical protein